MIYINYIKIMKITDIYQKCNTPKNILETFLENTYNL